MKALHSMEVIECCSEVCAKENRDLTLSIWNYDVFVEAITLILSLIIIYFRVFMFCLPVYIFLDLSEGAQRRFLLLTFSFRERSATHVLNDPSLYFHCHCTVPISFRTGSPVWILANFSVFSIQRGKKGNSVGQSVIVLLLTSLKFNLIAFKVQQNPPLSWSAPHPFAEVLWVLRVFWQEQSSFCSLTGWLLLFQRLRLNISSSERSSLILS